MTNSLKHYLSESGVTQEALAKALGVRQASVSRWCTGRVPAERVLAVEAATGGELSRSDLRPDLYPAESR